MIKPTVFGQAIILLAFAPLLTFTGVEGKTFGPMAVTIMLALVAAFVLAITMVPALVAILIRGKVAEKDVWLIRKSKKRYLPLLDKAIARPWPFILGGLAFFLAAIPVFGLLGSEFIPQLDEKNLAVASTRVPSVSLEQSLVMQRQIEAAVMALAHGTGAEVQKPLATTVIGGLIAATILTLLVLPAIAKVILDATTWVRKPAALAPAKSQHEEGGTVMPAVRVQQPGWEASRPTNSGRFGYSVALNAASVATKASLTSVSAASRAARASLAAIAS